MNSNFQEEGIRLNGQLLAEQEALAIVAEIRRQVRDPTISEEIEAFLASGAPLSARTRDALIVITTGVLMRNG